MLTVSTTDSGMGNRIKSLLSVMRLTDNPKVIWPINRFGNNSFNDLFENDIEVNTIPNGATEHFSPYLLLLDDDGIEEGFATEFLDIKSGKNKAINNGKSIDFQYNRIPQNVIDSIVPIVKSLTPIKYIRNTVDTYAAENFDENTVSIQIRTWKDDARRAPMFKKENYFKLMDQMPDKNFFVTADDQGIINEFADRYPGRVNYFQKRILNYEPGGSDCSKKEFGQDNLIDMLLLAKNIEIIGSHLSSFVECAWWFGGGRAKVTIL